jgi:hypothetical protein
MRYSHEKYRFSPYDVELFEVRISLEALAQLRECACAAVCSSSVITNSSLPCIPRASITKILFRNPTANSLFSDSFTQIVGIQHDHTCITAKTFSQWQIDYLICCSLSLYFYLRKSEIKNPT